MQSLLPSIVVLSIAAGVSVWLTISRDYRKSDLLSSKNAVTWLSLATGIQIIHFLEEYLTGFPNSLAEVFGLEPMSDAFFLAFNLSWITAWIWSIFNLEKSRFAVFAAWFLAVAGVANGILHPLLALVSTSYFPGLISSSFVGVTCFVLTRKLVAMSSTLK